MKKKKDCFTRDTYNNEKHAAVRYYLHDRQPYDLFWTALEMANDKGAISPR